MGVPMAVYEQKQQAKSADFSHKRDDEVEATCAQVVRDVEPGWNKSYERRSLLSIILLHYWVRKGVNRRRNGGRLVTHFIWVLIFATRPVVRHDHDCNLECSRPQWGCSSACSRKLVRDKGIQFLGILETRVRPGNVQSVRAHLLPGWSWFDDYVGPGGRIWIAWNDLEVGVDILMMDEQFIHCSLLNKRTSTKCLISIVYGDCDSIRRRRLWEGLQNLAEAITEDPWCVLGDFNAVIDVSESCGRSSETTIAMAEFREFITEAGLVHLPFMGCPYTWHNCSEGSRGLWVCLDKVLVNEIWLVHWPHSSYLCDLPCTSDHSPLILRGSVQRPTGGMFRFDNFLAEQPGFIDSVRGVWSHHIYGNQMYGVVCKLKALKLLFRAQRKVKGDLTRNVSWLRRSWRKLRHCLKLSKRISYFTCKINARRAKHRVYQIRNAAGFLVSDSDQLHLQHTLSVEEANALILPVTQAEIKAAFFEISEDSAPGPDGYTFAFYKAAWSEIGTDICTAVTEFFVSGRLLKQINATMLVLIPKVQLPVRVSDFRPIACCNVIYKAISKIMVSRTVSSVRTIKSGLTEFAELSGLHVNPGKSTIILSKAVQRERQSILDLMGFQEGSLPIKYLGVPLVSSRLSVADCQPLLDKINMRLAGWNHLNLSLAGRTQLIKSVLSSLHTYWASIFILPKSVIKVIEGRMRAFLWKGSASSGYAKVSWAQVCKTKEEGGLGVRSVLHMNQALMLKHVWRILQEDPRSIWVAWVLRHRLRNQTIWTYKSASASWC
ncbi:UNVERIFIED_CONTAM: hypothetical protein Slati_3110400 [Sesamum latifolium]|uniref:Reverse transcriptase n=1 Tax=Sesamum latifolium TaxID=2727402 RepID=A0AAW2UVC3_9LAMI